MRSAALSIYSSAVEAANPLTCVSRALKFERGCLLIRGMAFDLKLFSRILVVGAGKAVVSMVRGVENVCMETGLPISGHVVTKYHHMDHSAPLHFVTVSEGGHPIPDQKGVEGTKRVLELLQAAKSDPSVLIINVISGGGSALLCSPAPGVGLESLQTTTSVLLACGATIHEMNTIRKHLDRVKGGQLARVSAPCTMVCLLLSDVVGDDLDVIASGPCVPDCSTLADCWKIIRSYNLASKLPSAVLSHLEQASSETPKVGEECFVRCHNFVIGSNFQAIQAAQDAARKLGYTPLILSSRIEGEAREVAKVYAALAKEIASSGYPVSPPACLIAGGETTVTLRGKGKGGRNQELALAAAQEIAGWENIVILSGGTDGTDGPTDAAGGVVDGETVALGKKHGLSPKDFLDRNDSYNYFKQSGEGLITTGPTGTNVMDVALVLVDVSAFHRSSKTSSKL